MNRATSKIKTPTERQCLKARATPYCDSIAPCRSLGYVKREAGPGYWIVRVEIGRKNGSAIRRSARLGVADDIAPANGEAILSYVQAFDAARHWRFVGEPSNGLGIGARVERTLEDIVRRLNAIEVHLAKRRKPFPRTVTEVWRDALARLGGESPTGSGTRLLDPNGEWLPGLVHFDHFHGPDHNGLFDGWPVTRDENLSVLRLDREAHQAQFDAWVAHLRTLSREAQGALTVAPGEARVLQ